MKFVAITFPKFQLLQIYHRLSTWMSTAIEVSLPMIPSWIRILVRSVKWHHHFSHIHLSRTLFQTVYCRSRPITSMEHIWYTDRWNGLWSALQSALRSRNVVWRDGDWSTALLEGESSFHNFRKFAYCCDRDWPCQLLFLIILLGCREKVKCFFLFYSLWSTF